MIAERAMLYPPLERELVVQVRSGAIEPQQRVLGEVLGVLGMPHSGG
jgi:hypothetical protein